MRHKFQFLLAAILLLFNEVLVAQSPDSASFYIDIPVMDAPYNLDSDYSTFNMEQSIGLTKSFYYVTHYGIEKASEKWFGKRNKLWSRIIISLFDFAPLPLSNTWLHEEWHRSILSQNGYSSKNQHWTNKVSQVTDSDLIALKSVNPADMVREATSGNEGNLEYVLSLQKDKFFENTNTWNYSLYWGNYFVNSFYLFGSSFDHEILTNFKNGETIDISKRDVNGYDPINAVYDMFHPEESYHHRGIHPSGVGIDRYIEFRDLSPEAQKHMKSQFYLSFLNFVDPHLIGFNSFGNSIKWNATLRHHMTPFGYMVGANLFVKKEDTGLLISPKIFKNRNKTFLGVNTQYRKNWITLTGAVWQQPKNQSFYTTEGKLGGQIGIAIDYQVNNFTPYVIFNLKSEGWVEGNPYLSSKFTSRIGIKWNPFNN